MHTPSGFLSKIVPAIAALLGSAMLSDVRAQTNLIVTENALAGNLPAEWEVSGIGDPSIQGFATEISVNRGQTVSFKIHTDATDYRIDIYRLGYYGGLGARKVGTVTPSAILPQVPPAYVRDAATGLVDCGNWAVSASWDVPADATSGTAPNTWDGRHELTLDQTGLINGNTSLAGSPFKLVVSGGTAHSVVLQRMGATGGFTRMPPLGSKEIDQTNVALVTNWIANALPGRQTCATWRIAQSLPSTSQGAPSSDADFDGEDNYTEFLAGTGPLDGTSSVNPQVSKLGGNVSVTLALPANRSAQVETSTDLQTWSLWNVPGNQGIATPGGPLTLTGAYTVPRQFFRYRIRER